MINQFAEAIKDIDQAIELDPDYQDYYLRGKCKYGPGENEDASKDIDEAFTIHNYDQLLNIFN